MLPKAGHIISTVSRSSIAVQYGMYRCNSDAKFKNSSSAGGSDVMVLPAIAFDDHSSYLEVINKNRNEK